MDASQAKHCWNNMSFRK